MPSKMIATTMGKAQETIARAESNKIAKPKEQVAESRFLLLSQAKIQ